MPTTPRGEWLNPLNRMIWQRAFRAKETSMTLRNGQKFNIKYDYKGRTGKVWVQIDRASAPQGFDSFTPCGWFDYNEVVDPNWIRSE